MHLIFETEPNRPAARNRPTEKKDKLCSFLLQEQQTANPKPLADHRL
jgi:hypothetical protein